MANAGYRPWDKGGGPGHPDPYIRGEGGGGLVSQKKFFQFGSKTRGGSPQQAPPLDPPLMAKLYILKFFDRDKILSEMLHLNVYTW